MKNSLKQNQMANAIRFLSIDAIEKANSGHPGLPMGVADIVTVLYTRFMSHDPKNPAWPNRDRFILSAGHGSMLLYSILYLTGYEDITLDQIKKFRQLGARTAGHPEYRYIAGVETTTGPLGQGIANAVGMALAERLMNNRFGELVEHYTYVLVGDGCLMEGISQEAISLAGHLKLNKLIVIWDNNNISIDGQISVADSTNQSARFSACGWNVIEVDDGHDQEKTEKALAKARLFNNKPTLIACKTIIGFGSPNLSGTNKVHGSPLGKEEIAATRKALEWPYESFVIPPEILNEWRKCGLDSAKKRVEWEEKFSNLDERKRTEFESFIRGDLPGCLNDQLNKYKQELIKSDTQAIASRKASEMVLEVINAIIPGMIGGSADLTGSNNTRTSQMKSITAHDFSGNYVHYGVREHAMAAIMNGLALYGGFLPYAGTFLCFSDYMRPAMRLSSIMGLRVIYVMTHDSISLGEDGPTHQPVEHLASLRAIPNHLVFRPADAVEVAECWHTALQTRSTPSTIALSRHNLPLVRKVHIEENLCARGAYELVTSTEPAIVSIFSSGSEVEIALAASKKLSTEKISVRVVSIPCFELFENQDAEYQQKILGSSPIKIAVEAAIRQGWERFIGEHGIFIGVQSFGVSGSCKDLYLHFGITAEDIVSTIRKKLSTF